MAASGVSALIFIDDGLVKSAERVCLPVYGEMLLISWNVIMQQDASPCAKCQHNTRLHLAESVTKPEHQFS